MKTMIYQFNGDQPGSVYSIQAHAFGEDLESHTGPAVYFQAALHADEIPGALTLHHLAARLEEIETQGRLLSKVVIVPLANPVGLAQRVTGRLEGRFSLSTRENFNRGFPLFDPSAGPVLIQARSLVGDDQQPVLTRIKAKLLELAFASDIVLDLHADSDALCYVFAPEKCSPEHEKLGKALGCDAALLWSDPSDAAFEEAAIYPFLSENKGNWPSFAATVELRGLADVSRQLAIADSQKLLAYLEAIGTVNTSPGETRRHPAKWAGKTALTSQIALTTAPVGGVWEPRVSPGAKVAKGQLLGSIIPEPGRDASVVEIRAEQDSLVLTSTIVFLVKKGDTVLKMIGSQPSDTSGRGTLDD